MNQKFWTSETEQQAREYIRTRNLYLWNDYLKKPLAQLASVLIQRYARNFYQYYAGIKEDLIAEVVTQFSMEMVKWNPSKGSKTVYGWLYAIGKYYLSKIHQSASYAKRDYKLTLRGETPLYVGFTNDRDLDANYYQNLQTTEAVTYTLLHDADFIRFFCNWWKRNVHEVCNEATTRKMKDVILFIVNIIQHPENHVIGTSAKVIVYIARRMGVSKMTVSNIINKMKVYSPRIIREYEGKSLLSALLENI